MRVLLTGANGFIGSAIAARLASEGHTIIAAVRDPDKFRRRFPSAPAFAADMNQMVHEQDWQQHLEEVDAIINCAGALQSRHGQSLAAIHADAPIALFRAGSASGVRKIIQISAVSADAATEYAATKRAADEALTNLDCDWVILRPSIVYGAGAYGGTAMLRALAAAPVAIPVIGHGRHMATPIHVDDLVDCVIKCLHDPSFRHTVLSPCGPETLKLDEMCQRWRQWLGLKPAPFVHVPEFLVRAVAAIGDKIGNGPITTTSLSQLQFGNAASSAEFAAATGLKPRSMAKALAASPAQTGDLWHARLYLLRPFLRTSLVLIWLVSGLLGIFSSDESVLAALPITFLSDPALLLLGRAGGVADLAIAVLLVWNHLPRFTFWAQITLVLGYTILLSLVAPALWLDLFGPLLKNLPIFAIIVVDRILAEER